jgi:uncharacterized protein (DUF488 family)
MTHNLFTIGFTQTTAEQFFTNLGTSGVRRLIDVRLNNVSQLAGFAKRKDLEFFLKSICNIDYYHAPELAPTKDILDEYKKNKGSWQEYENRFLELMQKRRIERNYDLGFLDNACLLCSEKKPHNCHRRLVAEYLNRELALEFKIVHLT